MLRSKMPAPGVAADRIADRRSGDDIPSGEPIFTLRASDTFALRALTAYLSAIGDPRHAKSVAARIEDFKRFGREHQARINELPDVARSLQKRVGIVIRRHREAAHISQESFADSLQMHRAQYGFLERGRRDLRLSSLERVAEGLKVSLWEILKEADEY